MFFPHKYTFLVDLIEHIPIVVKQFALKGSNCFNGVFGSHLIKTNLLNACLT